MSKLDLNEVVEIKVTRRDAAVLVIALGMSAGKMPPGLEGHADRLCDTIQRLAPIGVMCRTMDEAAR